MKDKMRQKQRKNGKKGKKRIHEKSENVRQGGRHEEE